MGKFNLAAGAHIDGTMFERDGLMQNGRAPENSYGKSGWAKFLHGGGKFRLAYYFTPSQRLSLGGGWEYEAPQAANSFVAPRVHNNYIDNLTLEEVFNAEVAYDFRFGPLSGRVAGYALKFQNGVEQTAFYNDGQSNFTYLTMTGVDRLHYGLEAALNLQLTSSLSIHALGTISEAKYVSDPLAQVSYEGLDASKVATLNQWTNPVTGKTQDLCVFADGMHVSGTPLTALNVGVKYNIKGWYLGLDLNYYDRVYVDFSEYRRLSNVVQSYIGTVGSDGKLEYDVDKNTLDDNGGILYTPEGEVQKVYSPKQEKFKGGFMLDASIGRNFYLRHGRSLGINLSFSNILNNTNLRTGGYEQNRDDHHFDIDGKRGEAKAYKFSKNSKYYYANAFNFFLNVNYRF